MENEAAGSGILGSLQSFLLLVLRVPLLQVAVQQEVLAGGGPEKLCKPWIAAQTDTVGDSCPSPPARHCFEQDPFPRAPKQVLLILIGTIRFQRDKIVCKKNHMLPPYGDPRDKVAGTPIVGGEPI